VEEGSRTALRPDFHLPRWRGGFLCPPLLSYTVVLGWSGLCLCVACWTSGGARRRAAGKRKARAAGRGGGGRRTDGRARFAAGSRGRHGRAGGEGGGDRVSRVLAARSVARLPGANGCGDAAHSGRARQRIPAGRPRRRAKAGQWCSGAAAGAPRGVW